MYLFAYLAFCVVIDYCVIQHLKYDQTSTIDVVHHIPVMNIGSQSSITMVGFWFINTFISHAMIWYFYVKFYYIIGVDYAGI